MDCKESQRWMQAELDGELEPSVLAWLAAHRAGCAACREEFAVLEGLRTDLRANATRYSAPPHLAHRIRAALPRSTVKQTPQRRWSWAWINFGAALASTAAFGLTLSMYLAAPAAGELDDDAVLGSHFRSLQAGHLTDVVSSDQHTVKPWFTGKVDFAPPAVDFAAQDYRLVGGRLDYLRGRNVAALVYQHKRHVINVFVWPATAGAAPPAGARAHNGFHLLSWSEGGLAYEAVSDLAPPGLATLRDLMRAAEH